jgi:hypothetical protein
MGGRQQVLLTEHSGVDRRQPRGAEQLHRVHHHRQSRHRGQGAGRDRLCMTPRIRA